jgi:hypothetical protein
MANSGKSSEQLVEDAARLRYYLHDRSSSFRFKLNGTLAGEDVAELAQCWSAASSTLANRAFVVDVSGLSAIDDVGRELLSQWHQQGAEFIANSGWSRSFVESITGYALPPASPDAGWDVACLPLRIAPVLLIVLVILVLPGTVWAGSSRRLTTAGDKNRSPAPPVRPVGERSDDNVCSIHP